MRRPAATTPRRQALLLLLGLALALLLPAGPAAAAKGDPDYRVSRLACTGDDVRGTVTASADGATPLRVALVARFGKGAYRGTGLYVDLFPVPTPADYAFSFNVAALPPGATDYRVEATSEGAGRKKSKKLSDDACAPGAVVPEVPAGLLLPLTLGVSAALVVRVSTRRRALPA